VINAVDPNNIHNILNESAEILEEDEQI